jgi:pyridoxal 5'-phosphate synthase pdxT subunit
MKIGILALQGAFIEHVAALRRLGIEAVEVRLPGQLDGLDGLIIPGGESTTIGKLAVAYGLIEPLRAFGRERAIWGTCAGAIFLSKDAHRDQPLLGLMDIQVERNHFGRQVASFETDLSVPELSRVEQDDHPFHAVFIRAPLIESLGPEACPLAKLDDGRIVAARQNNLLATSFHPELSGDDRFHRYFVEVIAAKLPEKAA